MSHAEDEDRDLPYVFEKSLERFVLERGAIFELERLSFAMVDVQDSTGNLGCYQIFGFPCCRSSNISYFGPDSVQIAIALYPQDARFIDGNIVEKDVEKSSFIDRRQHLIMRQLHDGILSLFERLQQLGRRSPPFPRRQPWQRRMPVLHAP